MINSELAIEILNVAVDVQTILSSVIVQLHVCIENTIFMNARLIPHVIVYLNT